MPQGSPARRVQREELLALSPKHSSHWDVAVSIADQLRPNRGILQSPSSSRWYCMVRIRIPPCRVTAQELVLDPLLRIGWSNPDIESLGSVGG